MKLKPIVLAIAALSAGAANAAYTDTATNAYFTGASAIRANVAKAIKSMCEDVSGTVTVYKRGSSTSSLDNQMAYVCSAPMADTGITTVFHTTTGGSLTSILGMSIQAAKQLKPVSTVVGGTGNCNATSATGSSILDTFTVFHSCGEEAVASSDGGFSDLEYAPVSEQVTILDSGVDGFILDEVVQDKTGVTQAFGVAVSEVMYKALQTGQGLASCGMGLGDPTPACQPSLNRADVAAIMSNDLLAPVKSNGGVLAGLPANSVVEYARRVTTSGTQSSAQVYFLGKGCLTGPNVGELKVIGDEIASNGSATYNLGKFSVFSGSGTSNVTGRLTTPVTTPYVLGVVSAENTVPNPTGTTGWRFVKVNNVAISDGVKNKANGVSGAYDFAFEAVTYSVPDVATDADEGTVLSTIASKMATPSGAGGADTTGLWLNAAAPAIYTNALYPLEVSKYQRGGALPNSCVDVYRKKP